MKLRLIPLFEAVLLAAIPAHGAVTFTAVEADGNVVFSTTGGSLDLTAWTLGPSDGINTGDFYDGGSGLGGSVAPALIITPSDVGDAYSGPVNFSSPAVFDAFGFAAFNTVSGIDIGIDSFGAGFLFVPKGYVSNGPLGASSGTINSATLDSLGLIPGTYTWSWGNAGMQTADSFTLEIKRAPVPDGGSTALLGALALGSLAGVRRWLRRGMN